MASNLTVNRGTTYTIGFQYKKAGVNHTLVGSTVRFTIKTEESDQDADDSDALVIKNVTTGDSSGYAEIALTPEDTALIEPSKYYYDIKVDEDSDAVNVYKVIEGRFTLDGSPTNRLS